MIECIESFRVELLQLDARIHAMWARAIPTRVSQEIAYRAYKLAREQYAKAYP
jgi:hypothetical protein